MQKHSLGPRSPVKRDGEAQPECEGGTQQGKLKSKQQIKKKGGGGEKEEQTQGALFQSRHKNVSVSKSLSCKNSRVFEEKKKKSNKLKRGSQTSYIYLYI